MPLISFWSTNPDAVDRLSIEQIVSNAGDGNLKDNSECSRELRAYFSEVKTEKLAEYTESCLASSINKGGIVLQDLINELGRRLDYNVKNGRYQGVANAVGYDGIWVAPEGQNVVVEVKTTDAYTISLDKIATYRDKLLNSGEVKLPCSMLIVVGRQPTGELEAQIRGSRHAWDIRLISVDGLNRLVELKQEAENPSVGKKIRSLLVPTEYTKLDGLIDVLFDTAEDAKTTAAEVVAEDEDANETSNGEKVKGIWQFTPAKLIQQKREKIISALGQREKINLVRKSRALYTSIDESVKAACTLSKSYKGSANTYYWYAYHPEWDDFLGSADRSFLILGCMDLDKAFAIPREIIKKNLNNFNTSEKGEGEYYWHLHLKETSGRVELLLSKKKTSLELEKYAIFFK